jgi:hypothetical protein
MRTSESIVKIAAALTKAQKKMGSAIKGTSNPFFKSKYADLSAVIEAVKDPLNEFGLAILQPMYSKAAPEAGTMMHFVETIILHESGEYIASEPLKLELNKLDMQQLGSACSYARRYQLQSLLSVPNDDDDANAAVGHPKVETTKATQGSSSTTTVGKYKTPVPKNGGLF